MRKSTSISSPAKKPEPSPTTGTRLYWFLHFLKQYAATLPPITRWRVSPAIDRLELCFPGRFSPGERKRLYIASLRYAAMAGADRASPGALIHESKSIVAGKVQNPTRATTWILPHHFQCNTDTLPGDIRKLDVEDFFGLLQTSMEMTATHLYWIEAPGLLHRRHVLLQLPTDQTEKLETTQLYIAQNPGYFQWKR